MGSRGYNLLKYGIKNIITPFNCLMFLSVFWKFSERCHGFVGPCSGPRIPLPLGFIKRGSESAAGPPFVTGIVQLCQC